MLNARDEAADLVRGGRRGQPIAIFAWLAAGAIGAALLLAVLVFLMWRLSWPHVEPLGDPKFGINYSCNQAEYLLLEDPKKGAAGYVADDRPGRGQWCGGTLGLILSGTGAKHVRVSVEWSEVEPADGQFDFSALDAELEAARRVGAGVLLTIGIKAQRHPEFYIPEWVSRQANLKLETDLGREPFLRERALRMVATVAAHAAASPAIEAWGADNEPYVPSARANDWTLGRDFVRAEVALIHDADPKRRTVSINHAQHFVFDRRWEWALEDGDALGASLYPFRNLTTFDLPFAVPILELGPFQANYADQARKAHARGKQFLITELAAEPWSEGDIRLVPTDATFKDLTADHFRRNVDYARRSGADVVYLWGSEWWLYQKEVRGNGMWWELARGVLGPE